jgi:transcriptional regulator with XRE-family HTH domain
MTKLADWRTAAGLSQQALAEELGVDFRTIWRWENGKRRPRDPEMERLFVLSRGQVEPNDFYDLPRWRGLVTAPAAKLKKAA